MNKQQITLSPDEMRAALNIIKILEKFDAAAQLRILDGAANFLNPTARIKSTRSR